MNNSQLSGGTNIMNGRTNQAINMGRAYMGAYGGSYGIRAPHGGYSPSMSGFSGRSTGAPSGMGGMHVGGGGGTHGGGGGGHGGGGHR